MAYVFNKINKALGLPEEEGEGAGGIYTKNIGNQAPGQSDGANTNGQPQAPQTSPATAGKQIIAKNQGESMGKMIYSGLDTSVRNNRDTLEGNKTKYVTTQGNYVGDKPRYRYDQGQVNAAVGGDKNALTATQSLLRDPVYTPDEFVPASTR